MNLVIVFVGAGIGGVLRHLMNVGVSRLLGSAFPFATLLVNISGCLLMGLVIGYLTFRSGEAANPMHRLFLATGVLGGYTTFSAFSLDALLLVERGEMGAALIYVAGSVGLSLLAVFAGFSLMRAIS